MKKSLLFIIILLGFFLIVPNTYATDVYNTEANQYILGAWNYDATSCTDGTQDNCQKTTCYRPGSTCPKSTIIKYAVSDSEEKTFYVIKDDGTNMTAISSDNVVTGAYNDNENNISEGGPVVANQLLLSATNSWSNVIESNYYESQTIVDPTSGKYESYELLSIPTSAKVRLLTVAEAADVGCKVGSCPPWLGMNVTWLSDQTFALGSHSARIPSKPLATYVAGFTPFNSSEIKGIRAVISIPKDVTVSNDDNSSSDEKNATSSTSGKSNTNSQTVKVGDTLKTAIVGYIAGFIVLILGSIVLYKSLKKNNNINIVK